MIRTAAITLALLVPVGIVHADSRQFRAVLEGTQEVPAVSTEGEGYFHVRIRPDNAIHYELGYDDLEGAVTQAHIHIAQKGVNGGIIAFLCSNLGNGPAGTQPCPAPPARITGVIRAADVIGPAAQGIAPGELDEVIQAFRDGVVYANVHSTLWPGGEIRSQLGNRGQGHGHGHGHD